MNTHERLRQAIDQQQARLRANVPPDGEAALLALLRAQDRQPRPSPTDPAPDPVTGFRRPGLGGTLALQLTLASIGDETTPASSQRGGGLDTWANRFLASCDELAAATLVLTYCETGFMRMVDTGDGTFDAWIATKLVPEGWRERVDIDSWASFEARPTGPGPEATADVLGSMAHQLPYPAGATISSLKVQTWLDILAWIRDWAFKDQDSRGAIQPKPVQAVVDDLASLLAIDPGTVEFAIAAFTLDRENAPWHAAVPGPAPPLVRIGPEWLVPSRHGLTTEPLFFLTRELRRRDAEAYHNTAHLREVAFRQDLYALFQDKRFVTSAGRIELRRDSGNIRTDIDAAVFDRKTGTLGVFELKSQDPFARSPAELARQRDNVLYANRQVAGVLEWLTRHGPDTILDRIDRRAAKTFRVQKVYPFVLGRYLVHFNDGPEPDRRAAWGTWPQVLRLTDGQPFASSGGNPLSTLHTRLTKDPPAGPPPGSLPARQIDLGAAGLTIHPSHAAYRASTAPRGPDHLP